MIAVTVVQPPFMYKVTVVTVGNTLIAVRLVVPSARSLRAFCRILAADRQLMLVTMVTVR
jgi:hypothetical protein